MSIGSNMRTDVGTLQASSVKIDDLAAQLQTNVQHLDSLIAPLSGTWSGSASSSFQLLHRTWMERQEKLRQVLVDISAGVKTNAVKYQQNEDEVESVMQRTAATLA